MKQAQRWQIFLIIGVVILTVVNIMPTVFYYTKPLHKPVNAKTAEKIAVNIAERVNSLEDESLKWIRSYAKLLHLKTDKVLFDKQTPDQIKVKFSSDKDAEIFRSRVENAGRLIPFLPAQLHLSPQNDTEDGKSVTLKRQIPIHFQPKDVNTVFKFSKKRSDDGGITANYKELIIDRLSQILLACAGTSENARYLEAVVNHPDSSHTDELTLHLAQVIQNYSEAFGPDSPIAHRLFSTFTQGQFTSASAAVNQLAKSFDQLQDKIKLQRIALEAEVEQTHLASAQLEALKKQENLLTSAKKILKTNSSHFAAGKTPLDEKAIRAKLSSLSDKQSILLDKNNPFIESIDVDWAKDKLHLHIYPDVIENQQLLYSEIARISRETKEDLKPCGPGFEIALSQMDNSESFLLLDLGQLALKRCQSIINALQTEWKPEHIDFQKEHFPVWDHAVFKQLSSEQRAFGLHVYAPAAEDEELMPGFNRSSIYVIAKGADQILKKHTSNPNSPEAQAFIQDFQALQKILMSQGFQGYPGTSHPFSNNFSKDYIFEAQDYYAPLLQASREDFRVLGTNRFAMLEFTDHEQRILTENRIDTERHENLLKWNDDYQTARYSRDTSKRYDIAEPTQSGLMSNVALSIKKYFRGDDRKILHWGLDLSGGKTVRIELRDQNNQIVTDEMQVDQGLNELYARVNKMGVSEVSIRREGHHILLDFPGSQNYSASDLVKASSMYFHVINEQFSPYSPTLGEATSLFLQGVWNEAQVTGKQDVDSINAIAYEHLYGGSAHHPMPKTQAAKTLYESGLSLSNPLTYAANSSFNDSVSKIALWRGESQSDWQGQPNPLMIVFSNYALEGSSLTDVRAGYDPAKGNYLSFSVGDAKSRDDLGAWTGNFCKEKVVGTPLAAHTNGRGYRMAVILNGSVVNAPALESGFSDSAMITGSFTQREINKLEADLKAGSLSFAPKILSEQNVSPELGQKDRAKGIIATVIALVAVIAMMIGYYRFAGVVASCAVIFNLLMMWATLQNIQAALTLAGIAGIILTLGMAVDANVLVFERVREEFDTSGDIKTALQTGYKKAFTAIFDSNITTLIAALVLLNFDSGPIKAFAIMLIIGIVSSMFSALFLTRTYFNRWAQNPKNTALKMSTWIKTQKINFLGFAKYAISASILLALVGGFFLFKDRNSILGMDFTGGYSLNLEVKAGSAPNYREVVQNALLKSGLNSQDFSVRTLSPSNHLRIDLSSGMENEGRPYHGMPFVTEAQKNPRLNWIVDALQKEGVELAPEVINRLDQNWNAMSGQISGNMRKSAAIGGLLAFLCILIYITIRFEFKYAISATLSLAHDVALSIACIGIFHALGMPIQIDLTTVAALMTIVGYSLNDTIIVFDRIREDIRLHHKTMRFKDIVNHALNVTLSRTLMTSATTLVVLVALVLFGGQSILGFALIMTMGVIIGTISSIFIATTLIILFHQREQGNSKHVALNAREVHGKS
ncbi:MAG: protein translocase subunit SecD [Chlamydiales bacterium]|nr:protein translocase subunit SecD [Chlamydiales bacterium]